jgi:hypothetical protein
VSEQTGKISYAEGGNLTRNVQPSVLKDFLEEKLQNISQETMKTEPEPQQLPQE